MDKDVSIEELEGIVEKIDTAEKAHNENEKLNNQLDEMIAELENLIRGPKTTSPEVEGVTHGR